MKHIGINRKLANNKLLAFDVFTGGNSYHNSRLYYSNFGKHPSIITINNVDPDKLRLQLEAKYGDVILDRIEVKEYDKKNKERFEDVFYFLENNVMLSIYNRTFNLYFQDAESDVIQTIRDEALSMIQKKKKESSIHLMINSPHGIETTKVKYKKTKLHLDLHYNDGFDGVHQSILDKLQQKNSNGLFLLHGKPGTGKSTYIRHLIRQLKKKVIFMSPNMAGQLDHMELTRFLINNKNTVFVIEDAEQLIASRENERNSSLSTLLNLTDGILGECLSIQVIATFNTHVKNIDKALLRKGRLQLMYEFDALSVEKSNELLQELNSTHETAVPLTLAEIYNFEADNLNEESGRKVIGFR